MISKIWIKVWGKASGLFGSKSLWLAFSFGGQKPQSKAALKPIQLTQHPNTFF